MSIAAIILNYRTPAMTLDCLRSLAPEAAALAGLKAVVVDNGSGDGSADEMRGEIERNNWHWATVLALPESLGFSAGNNRGLALAGDAEYVLLLNSDTLLHAGCLAHCRQVMQSQPDIGLMSCTLIGRNGRPQATARRFTPPRRQFIAAFGLPWQMRRLFGWADPELNALAPQPRDVDWVSGAFMFCRGDLLARLKGLDEDFFFYGEDYELCHRVHKAGFRVHYDPRVSITHLGGGSSDESRLAVTQKTRLAWRGRYMIYRKCHGRLAEGFVRSLDLLNYGGRALVHRLLRGRQAERYQHSARVFQLLARRP